MNIRTWLVAFLLTQLVAQAHACPFCSAVSQTFSEEMKMMDVVALTKLKSQARVSSINSNDSQEEVPKSTFEITKVIKGGEYIKVGDTFETIYFGEAKKDRAFLAMATDAPNLVWSTPLILTDRAKDYVSKVKEIPDGPERLEFFQNYLEDEDEMLARDAYDEFAKAPYSDVIALKPKMKRAKLLEFIKNRDVPANRRRLYFTMLGVCGTQEDAKLLEQFMESDDRKSKSGLDAMLACYVLLKGEKGLDKVDEFFLKNKDAEYADTYAAIMAIRFHGSETDFVPRKRLVKSLRHMLDRPELADLVIPDLARWEDWEVMTKLCDLFVRADENSSWVRVPVVNYLRVCPLPLAKEKIEELKLVDADAVKRAMMFFPVTDEKKEDGKKEGTGESDTGSQKSTADDSDAESKKEPASVDVGATLEELKLKAQLAKEMKKQASLIPLPEATDPMPVLPAPNSVPAEGKPVAQAGPMTSVDKARSLVKSNTSIDTPETLNQVESIADEKAANPWLLIGVTTVAAGLCLATMRSILGVGRA